MPVKSLPVRDPAFHRRLLEQYLLLLKKYPILTKSVTSGILSALGNLLSQALESRKKRTTDGNLRKGLNVLGPARFAVYGLFCTGPLSHYFYQLMELVFPSSEPYCALKRLLLDRLVFAPAFLLLFFFVMNVLEGRTISAFQGKVRAGYWPALKMNWKVWTPFQFININYVPVQFRVLFANLVALFWYAYLASVRK
ncbi:peroxisomal membrane protein 2 [Anguilla rostrata]|uniref:Peroxisomal membrane protein 2 n=1 Tax=Anguilla anguilla TaxID=7936 RepID=A0A0E9XNA4_ANGAN